MKHTKTDLQEQVYNRVVELLDSNHPTLPICVDKFKPTEELGTDAKIKAMGIEEAAQKIVDDSLFWAGYFHGVGGL